MWAGNVDFLYVLFQKVKIQAFAFFFMQLFIIILSEELFGVHIRLYKEYVLEILTFN